MGIVAMTASAQDIITRTDGSTIAAKVSAITPEAITYHRHDNPTGPLYTIPVSSVSKIRYENGTVETFSGAQSVAGNNQATPMPVLQDQSRQLSDNQLLGIGNYSPSYYYNKARKLKKIGIIGGATLVVGSIITGVLVWEDDKYGNGGTDCPIIIGAGVGAGLIWWGAFQLASNRQMNKAREAQLYSTSIIECDPISIGDNSLVAGVNIMNDQLTRSHGIGLGLKFNF